MVEFIAENGKDAVWESGTIGDSAQLLPPIQAEPKRLAPLDPDHRANTLKQAIMNTIDETLTCHMDEIDDLIDQLNEIKTEMTNRTHMIKTAINQHYDLYQEASGFSGAVRRRMNEIRDGGS